MRDSAFPDWIKCSVESCPASSSSVSSDADHDELTVASLRNQGWAVVDGQWVCDVHAPEGANLRRRNPHCSNCGDLRGGAYGHEAYECTWVG